MNRPRSPRPNRVDDVNTAICWGANMSDRRFEGDAIEHSLGLTDAPLLTARAERAIEQKGRLTPSQLVRATELLVEKCFRDILLGDIAREVGLSRQYFTKSFKATLGVTPHRWLQLYRLQKAKDLLQHSSHPIADIAIECGFADQSHLTRVFVMLTGSTPAAWRREYRSGFASETCDSVRF
jgi:AraC-like DNA-binding protein